MPPRHISFSLTDSETSSSLGADGSIQIQTHDDLVIARSLQQNRGEEWRRHVQRLRDHYVAHLRQRSYEELERYFDGLISSRRSN